MAIPNSRHSSFRKTFSSIPFLQKIDSSRLRSCKKKLTAFTRRIRYAQSPSEYWDAIHPSEKRPAPQRRMSITLSPEEKGQLPWFSRHSLVGTGLTALSFVRGRQTSMTGGGSDFGDEEDDDGKRGHGFFDEHSRFESSVTEITSTSTLESGF